ncbi:MAG: peptide deformylase [Phycisphaerales bacterium]|nr:peptide deformylase [Phycisphaerales bacterium]
MPLATSKTTQPPPTPISPDMYQDLQIIFHPDPRLKKRSVPVQVFDENLKALASRMLELMRQASGVGLAAPQVGLNYRLFVMNATGNPEDDRVYVNPELYDPAGEEEGEEGCLSLPKIAGTILRNKSMRLKALDLDGNPVEAAETGFIARIWQHETDHLNGVLITDRMGSVEKMAARKILRELEQKFNGNK